MLQSRDEFSNAKKVMEVENVLWGWEAAAYCKAGNSLLWGGDTSGSSYWQANREFLNTVYCKYN